MKRLRWPYLVCFGLSALLSFVLTAGSPMLPSQAIAPALKSTYEWKDLPEWAPKPMVPAENPMTDAKVELGRHLFYEQRLSVTGDYACATCHKQALAFTDGKPVSVGATGERHPRAAMSLTNVAYASVLTWANPLTTDLEEQLLVPMFGEEPVEMGLAGLEGQILQMLEDDLDYRQRFRAAFPDEIDPVSVANIAKAIASFERSLVSFNSPYDRYRYGGEPNAISAAAKRGERLFNSERLECFHCHGGLNFSDSTWHERKAFREYAFHNTGLYNLDGEGAYPPENPGAYEITLDPADMGHFRAPTLRNIALTAPYMHDGSIATLEAALEHYSAGGREIATGPQAGDGRQNPLKSHFITGFTLSATERQDLVAFLESLTDESFATNPAFGDPNSP